MNLQNQVNYLKTLKSVDIFDGLSVPDPLNADAAKSAIMTRCGLLTPVYSEPDVMRAAITQWSVRMQWTFKHLINIIQAEYSPIENTDRYSEHTSENKSGNTRTHSGNDLRTEEHSGKDTKSESGSTGITRGGTDTNTESGSTTTTDSGTDTTTNEVSAYNSNGYQPDRKESLSHGLTETVNHGKIDTETRSESETTTHGKQDTFSHGERITENTTHGLKISDTTDGQEKYTEHTHGNIGVTTNQQLIEQELELLRHFDIYGFIAEKFESEFCLMIY